MSKSSYIDEQVHTTVDGRERALLAPDWTPEEETRARQEAQARITALTTDQAEYDRLVMQADQLALSKPPSSFPLRL
jgi:hypothetical protein